MSIHPNRKAPFSHAVYKAVVDEIARLERLHPNGWPTAEKELAYNTLVKWRDMLESPKQVTMTLVEFPPSGPLKLF